MKKNLWLLLLVLCAANAVFGCTAMTGVPQGSVLVGVYKGAFNGDYNEGSIEVKLYQSPENDYRFDGHLGQDGNFVNIEGEMKAGELQGQILLPFEGTLSGKLSADKESLSGTYKFAVPPYDHGTWQARKQ